VNGEELGELISDCPSLYHMAMKDSWPMIREHGLLCTEALLKLFEIDSNLASTLLNERRPKSVPISHSILGQAVVRDQIPMHESDLLRCLRDGLTPKDWYKLLNERVFFWLTEERLERLLCAGAYRNLKHLVLKVPTRVIIERYYDNIELAPMNTGCTKPMPHPRGADTFLPIEKYPYAAWKKKRKRGERVVELTVIGGVPDISNYVDEVSVRSCGGSKVIVDP
jgi:hypothetical protein